MIEYRHIQGIIVTENRKNAEKLGTYAHVQ